MSKGIAFVVGATGMVGRAAVPALVADGWEVRAASRGGDRVAGWPGEVRTVTVDRNEEGALEAALGEGCDVLVDVVAYGKGHAQQLAGLADRVGSAVVISSLSVYEDSSGRSLATQGEPDGAPRFPLPMPETQATVAADEAAYAGRKVALEQELLASALPATLLRAGAIHGPYCKAPRELFFVKRALDGRPVRVLAYGGRSRFQPVHSSNVAELIRLAASKPGARVLNAADPQAPTVAEISAAVDGVLGVRSELVTFEGKPVDGTVGATPWSGENPVVLDMAAAERELGYRPVTSYADSLPVTVALLAERLRGKDWREAFPDMARTYDPHLDLFDYAAEDTWLAAR
ncbi:NAD-dependent epimerase/dehydratase family protein [Streptomyces beijiangensis]|uniref:NAD(P)H-binding protein n=1 Tax=Streptomyces beijiangensis TaxID=163361 RepID=A0A939F681_9ACTN|nr:NAD-dependent epimerase/dehydratase family protein [Streptomyces beijiangensis]MBO0511140.1 NAD(P)H-binding protein [Streptomyces beijiangensis]